MARKSTSDSSGTGGHGTERILRVGRHEVHLTHLEKPYWPDEGITKGDLIDYYDRMHKWILPHLKGRPQSLHRQLYGIKDKGFFQKDVSDQVPSWVRTERIEAPSVHRDIHYVICDDRATLLQLANMGCIELHDWHSRVGSLDRPDYLAIDLDPTDKNTFDQIVEVALCVKEVLDRIGAPSFFKTSGARGAHVYVPLRARYTYEEIAPFAERIAARVHALLPAITTMERRIDKRAGRIYLDHQQNHRGQTLAAVYSVRSRPGATVSTPMAWSEVKPGLDRSRFNIRTVPGRVEKLGDLFKGVLGKGIDLKACRKRLEVSE